MGWGADQIVYLKTQAGLVGLLLMEPSVHQVAAWSFACIK